MNPVASIPGIGAVEPSTGPVRSRAHAAPGFSPLLERALRHSNGRDPALQRHGMTPAADDSSVGSVADPGRADKADGDEPDSMTAAALASTDEAALRNANAAQPATPASIERSLAALDPEFRSRLDRVLDRMRDEYGYEVRVTETFRTQSRQDALYAQGRSAPGPTVTWTRNSNHTMGLAVDVLITDADDAAWATLAKLAAEEGVHTLGPSDPGHVELSAADALAAGRGGPAGRESGPVDRGPASPATPAAVARIAEPARVATVAVPGLAVAADRTADVRRAVDHSSARAAVRRSAIANGLAGSAATRSGPAGPAASPLGADEAADATTPDAPDTTLDSSNRPSIGTAAAAVSSHARGHTDMAGIARDVATAIRRAAHSASTTVPDGDGDGGGDIGTRASDDGAMKVVANAVVAGEALAGEDSRSTDRGTRRHGVARVTRVSTDPPKTGTRATPVRAGAGPAASSPSMETAEARAMRLAGEMMRELRGASLGDDDADPARRAADRSFRLAGLEGTDGQDPGVRLGIDVSRTTGPTRAAEVVASAGGPDIASRVERLLALQDAMRATPATGMTLDVGPEDGTTAARIRLGLRGNAVDALIDVADPNAAARLSGRVSELRQALERTGLEPATVAVREGLATQATSGGRGAGGNSQQQQSDAQTGRQGWMRRDPGSPDEHRNGRRNSKENGR